MNVSALINASWGWGGWGEGGGLALQHAPTRSLSCLVFLQVEPFLPYEYTCEGMLERVHAYIQNQVGAGTGSDWISQLPPRASKV